MLDLSYFLTVCKLKSNVDVRSSTYYTYAAKCRFWFQISYLTKCKVFNRSWLNVFKHKCFDNVYRLAGENVFILAPRCLFTSGLGHFVTGSGMHALLATGKEEKEDVYSSSYETVNSSLFIFFVYVCHTVVLIFPNFLIFRNVLK